MEKAQIQKELYELELRKVALDSEVTQFRAALGSIEKKQMALALGAVGSALAMLVPAIGLWGGTAGLVALSPLSSKYEKEERRLRTEFDRRMEERKLTDRRMGDLRADLREEQQKERDGGHPG